nr:hypothetical protein [Streptomyces clavuligerus]
MWPREALPAGTVPYTRAAIDAITHSPPYTELGWDYPVPGRTA